MLHPRASSSSDHGVGRQVEAEAAQVGRGEAAEDAQIRHPRHERRRVVALALVVLGGGHHVLVDELAHGEDDLSPLLRLALARGQRAEALAVAVEQAPRDDQSLDLVGAFPDDHERRVAVEALEPEIGALARRSRDAHGAGGRLLGRLRGVELGDARLEVAALAPVLHAGRPVRHEPGRLHAGRDVAEQGRRLLMPCPRRRARRVLECRLRDADRARRDIDPARSRGPTSRA